jgi:Zn-dependent protease with chaperone function
LAPPEREDRARDAAEARTDRLKKGLLALPNLFFRSLFTLGLLYGLLGLVLITIVTLGYLTPSLAVVIGVTVAILQFALGPYVMDLSLYFVYKMRWVGKHELPDHLREFIQRVCDDHNMRFPHVGIIDDSAPTAFTYGHHPNNARVVFSRGILELLEPEEVEAVIAHELGHARNWDMALMTLANLVPLLLYYVYSIATRSGDRGKDRAYAWAVAAGAYILYIVAEYLVLWFSRTREYFADRFAGKVTNNPNAMARALVKIAYGLAAQAQKEKSKDGKTEKRANTAADAFGSFNISDRGAATALVMGAGTGDTTGPDVERVKGAMQWDLWNPWASWFEIHSTHPLTAKRIRYLSDQAAAAGQDPWVVFDRAKPESYWDDFLVDLLVTILPALGLILGAGVAFAIGWSMERPLAAIALAAAGLALSLAGIGSLIKTWFSYRTDYFPHLTVAALLHKVKVSGVRPVPVTLSGTIIGKGVPGLIWSEDFVLRDPTGIIFLDYRQPLGIWSWLFGLFRAERYQGKQVRVHGWFRRAPVPYLEIKYLEVIDGSERPRNCYTYHARLGVAVLLAAGGLIVFILGLIGA